MIIELRYFVKSLVPGLSGSMRSHITSRNVSKFLSRYSRWPINSIKYQISHQGVSGPSIMVSLQKSERPRLKFLYGTGSVPGGLGAILSIDLPIISPINFEWLCGNLATIFLEDIVVWRNLPGEDRVSYQRNGLIACIFQNIQILIIN